MGLTAGVKRASYRLGCGLIGITFIKQALDLAYLEEDGAVMLYISIFFIGAIIGGKLEEHPDFKAHVRAMLPLPEPKVAPAVMIQKKAEEEDDPPEFL